MMLNLPLKSIVSVGTLPRRADEIAPKHLTATALEALSDSAIRASARDGDPGAAREMRRRENTHANQVRGERDRTEQARISLCRAAVGGDAGALKSCRAAVWLPGSDRALAAKDMYPRRTDAEMVAAARAYLQAHGALVEPPASRAHGGPVIDVVALYAARNTHAEAVPAKESTQRSAPTRAKAVSFSELARQFYSGGRGADSDADVIATSSRGGR